MTPQLWGVIIGFLVGIVMMRLHRRQAALKRRDSQGGQTAVLNTGAGLSPLIWAGIGWLVMPFLIPQAP